MTARAKGTNFVGLLDALERQRGKDAVERAIAALDGEARDAIANGAVITSGWYPVRWYGQLHRAIQASTGGGLDLSRELARLGVRRDLSGIYRFFLMVLTPANIIRRAPRVFSTYFDTGRMTVPEAEAGRARAVFEGCEDFDASVWADLEGGCTGAIEACGGQDVTVHRIRGGGDLDRGMEIEIHWS